MFLDRNKAANQLAEKLIAYKGKNPLVLAIPRGAVPMAARQDSPRRPCVGAQAASTTLS